MAVTHHYYGAAGKHLWEGNLNWTSHTFKVTLHTSSYSPNQDTHDYFDDVTNELTTSGGYTAGGATITTPAKTYDSATNEERLTGDNVTWTALTPSSAFRYAVCRRARGGAASADELVSYIDFGADQNPSGLDFSIQWPTTGVGYALAS